MVLATSVHGMSSSPFFFFFSLCRFSPFFFFFFHLTEQGFGRAFFFPHTGWGFQVCAKNALGVQIRFWVQDTQTREIWVSVGGFLFFYFSGSDCLFFFVYWVQGFDNRVLERGSGKRRVRKIRDLGMVLDLMRIG